jgi:hypothetical protein
LTWANEGWGAALTEGRGVFLREFSVDGRTRGDRVALLEEPSTPARVHLTWSNGSYYIAVSPHAPDTATRVFRATRAGTEGDAFALDDVGHGEVSLVARNEVPSAPVALWYEDPQGVALRLVARDGEPGSVRRCPREIALRAVSAWRDGFRALAVQTDAASGEANAIDLVALDDACALQWRVRLWQGALNGRAHSLTVDEEGTVAAFTDREGGAWLAGANHEGRSTLRATRMERHARSPQVFAQTDARRRRIGLQVVAVRTIETGDRLEVWRLAPDGLLREVRQLAASPSVELFQGVADPWGGALVSFAREETTHGSARTGAGAYGFFARVCP